ncbi:hypothetical protein [Natrinema sp. SYSU A 869]|uniref:hypothetical protein n=1 Tax=Natrinema sp. SYSU A 869 TaxID=2871694 RepID=UPI001CA42C5F|nr:hypothetical protein [Natrinema sp. SYSU A 869]
MTALASIPDDRSTASGVLLPLVLAVTVAGALIAPVTAASAATTQDNSGEISIERTNDFLEISLSGFDERPDEVTIEVAAANESASTIGNSSDGQAEVAITELVSEINHVSLSDANVTVTAGDASESETLDLRTIAFADADDVPVWLSGGDGSQVILPLDQRDTVGLTESDSITISANGDDLSADVRANGTQLAIDQSALVETVGSTDEIALEASIVDDRPTERTLQPQLRDVADRPVLWYPLLEPGTAYGISAEDDRERQYVNSSVDPVRAGEIDLSPLSGAAAVTASVSMADEGTTVLENEELTLERPAPLSATVMDDGAAVSFDQSVDGLGVSSVIVNSSVGGVTQYALGDGTMIENRRLALSNATVTATDKLVLATDAGIARVTLNAAESGSDRDNPKGMISTLLDVGIVGAPLLIPGLLGLVVGYGSYWSRNERTKKRLGISAIIATGLASATAIGLVFLLPGEPPSIAPSFFGAGIDISFLEVALWPHGFAGSGVLLGAVLAPVLYYRLSYPIGVDRSAGFTVDVTVTDGNQPLTGRTKIGYRRVDNPDAEANETAISGGVGRLTVPERGTWNLAAKHKSHESDVVKVSRRKTSVTLTIVFPTTVTVTDGTDSEPIPGAAITRTDSDTTETTGVNGTATLEPGTPGSSIEIEITHEKYATRTETINFSQNGDRTIELAPRTGRARLVSRVDGVQTPSMPIRLSSREKALQDRYGTIHMTTDRDAVATREGLLIGQYRAEIDPPDGRGELFDGGKPVLTVREDRSTKVGVDAHFTWSLSSSQRDRIDRLRRKVRTLSDHSGRDTTIPQYYGSVVVAILETVESLPEDGHHFAHSEATPDAVADALLAAAAKAIDAINDAMTTKRNVDLFAACADMPDPGVDWDGDCDLETVLEWLESDAITQRNELKDRYETVTGQVETERKSVSEAAPAEEMLRHAWDLGSDAGRGPEAIVTIYVSLLLLEAVADVFEHDALCDRLSRTVF